ncbi:MULTISPECIES: N-succinylarginine dihydrolase [Photorhabdus]|uniref:N-succinylarginine dihydrolase n=1 Tax=Photorhabdus aegyptia TaxID=2805098 RepID=A0A022PMQ7_9GAMM|nr:N-succinylarginine dihydrolase [Photorhabdus aegyptia]EYU16886.1 succinylarginine dihydrolase [Photorhabdus aegyptia]MCC8459751.1 N-succinylarginine dihydrolase [Photorhabdus aegyptia]PQQ39897.1 N-succinylarginine dihydrolase [Photorhabdus luminescens]
MAGFEANFDGLVGLTHHYAGLSVGNKASINNKDSVSNPRKAALQGVMKMKALADAGFIQGVLPPQQRPNIPALRNLGFVGSDEQILHKAAKYSPVLLSKLSSASSMWTANAATVSPSADSADQRVHFTVANLNNKLHRSLEVETTAAALKATFADQNYFVHHQALPQHEDFGDEGAANHNRLGGDYDTPGVQVFVYGRSVFRGGPVPKHYPARQTLEASEAIARLHQLNPAQTVFVQQNPVAIDSGVFHNDVIAVSNRNVLFHHQHAYLHQSQALAEIKQKLAVLGQDFVSIEVPSEQVSIKEAVNSYLFNSQLLSKTDGKMMIVVPEECRQNAVVWSYLQSLIAQSSSPINEVCVFDLRESMRNGGGPACLRLRVVLNDAEFRAVNPATLLNTPLYNRLTEWITRHYRDELCAGDLVDPQLLREVYTALDELTQILNLGSIYEFQR